MTSGKGGVGKTTITANLGAALAKRGNQVALIDADIGLNNLDVVMGIENKVAYDIVDVTTGRCRLKQALIRDANHNGLYVLPSAHFGSARMNGAEMKIICDNLSENFDYILIDCPAGIDGGFHRAVCGANEALVVVTPNISSIRDADKVITLLNSYELNSIGVIINRVRGDLVLLGEMMSVSDIMRLLKMLPAGVIPEDDDISLYACIGKTLEGGSGAGKAFGILADNIIHNKGKIYDCLSQYRGFRGRLKLRRR